MNHLRGVAHLDTWPMVASLYRERWRFDQETRRQTAPGSPHQDTRAIMLRVPAVLRVAMATAGGAPDLDYAQLAAAWFADAPHDNGPAAEEWGEARDLLDAIAATLRVPRESLGKAMVVELKPEGAIAWHTDDGDYAPQYDRYHLPLLTNPMAFLLSGGEQAHVPVGCLTFFDTQVLHSAVNLGAQPRVHLLVDVRRGAGIAEGVA